MSEKQREILIKSLSWFIALFMLIFIGVNNVFAETLTGMKFANRNYNQFPFSTDYEPYTYNADYFTFRGTEGTPNYMILNVCGTGLLDFNISNSSGQFKYLGYVEQSNISCTTQGYSGYEYIYYFNFVKFDDAGGGDFGVSFNNTITNAYGYNTYVTFKSITFSNTSNLDVLKQQQDIINQNNQNTQNIINNQNTNNENLIDSNLQNTQDIINNQNQNTQDLINDNKKNFQTCRDSVNLFNKSNVTIYNAYMDYEKWLPANDSRSIRVPVQPNTTYTVSTTSSLTLFRVAWTNSENVPVSSSDRIPVYDQVRQTNNTPITITTGNDAKYIIIQINFSLMETAIQTLQVEKGNFATGYEPYGEEICVNKLDEQTKTSKGILGKIGDLFNTLFSNDDADISGLDNMVGWLPPGPVDSIINLPLSLFNSLTNTLSGTCVPVTLTLPFVNQNLTLPCFDAYMSQYVSGFNTLWTWVGVTVSVFILYRYLLNLYKWIDDTLTMRENNLPGYYDDNMWGGA